MAEPTGKLNRAQKIDEVRKISEEATALHDRAKVLIQPRPEVKKRRFDAVRRFLFNSSEAADDKKWELVGLLAELKDAYESIPVDMKDADIEELIIELNAKFERVKVKIAELEKKSQALVAKEDSGSAELVSDEMLEQDASLHTTGPVADFFIQVEPMKENVEGIVLPDHVPSIVTSEADSQGLFDIALDAWKQNFIPNKIKEAINFLKAKNITDKDRRKVAKYFLEIRRIGVLAGTAYTNLSDQHNKAPDVHRQFMRELGQARDSVKFKTPDELSEVLSRLEATLDEYPGPEAVFASFKPADKESFDDNFRKRIDTLKTLIGPDTITAEQSHDIRKKGSRQLLNLYLLSAMRERSPEALNTYLWLWRVDNNLGETNDQVVMGKIKENDPVTVSSELKQILQQYFERIETSEPATSESVSDDIDFGKSFFVAEDHAEQPASPAEWTRSVRLPEETAPVKPKNARCPNCHAVFPTGGSADSMIECPLCLLRFERARHEERIEESREPLHTVAEWTRSVRLPEEAAPAKPKNARCPNCNAVFPVGSSADSMIECPLCLLRFERARHEERIVQEKQVDKSQERLKSYADALLARIDAHGVDMTGELRDKDGNLLPKFAEATAVLVDLIDNRREDFDRAVNHIKGDYMNLVNALGIDDSPPSWDWMYLEIANLMKDPKRNHYKQRDDGLYDYIKDPLVDVGTWQDIVNLKIGQDFFKRFSRDVEFKRYILYQRNNGHLTKECDEIINIIDQSFVSLRNDDAINFANLLRKPEVAELVYKRSVVASEVPEEEGIDFNVLLSDSGAIAFLEKNRPIELRLAVTAIKMKFEETMNYINLIPAPHTDDWVYDGIAEFYNSDGSTPLPFDPLTDENTHQQIADSKVGFEIYRMLSHGNERFFEELNNQYDDQVVQDINDMMRYGNEHGLGTTDAGRLGELLRSPKRGARSNDDFDSMFSIPEEPVRRPTHSPDQEDDVEDINRRREARGHIPEGSSKDFKGYIPRDLDRRRKYGEARINTNLLGDQAKRPSAWEKAKRFFERKPRPNRGERPESPRHETVDKRIEALKNVGMFALQYKYKRIALLFGSKVASDVVFMSAAKVLEMMGDSKKAATVGEFSDMYRYFGGIGQTTAIKKVFADFARIAAFDPVKNPDHKALIRAFPNVTAKTNYPAKHGDDHGAHGTHATHGGGHGEHGAHGHQAEHAEPVRSERNIAIVAKCKLLIEKINSASHLDPHIKQDLLKEVKAVKKKLDAGSDFIIKSELEMLTKVMGLSLVKKVHGMQLITDAANDFLVWSGLESARLATLAAGKVATSFLRVKEFNARKVSKRALPEKKDFPLDVTTNAIKETLSNLTFGFFGLQKVSYGTKGEQAGWEPPRLTGEDRVKNFIKSWTDIRTFFGLADAAGMDITSLGSVAETIADLGENSFGLPSGMRMDNWMGNAGRLLKNSLGKMIL